MLAILQIELELFETFHAITSHVVNYLPEEPEFPLIHVESIERNVWIHKPYTMEVEMKIGLYALGHSNKEILEFGEQVLQAIDKLNYPKRIENNVVAQVKNDLWCNDITLKIWTTHKEGEL